jgi:hypothetical protein
MNYLEKLISNCESAMKAIPSREFVMQEISELDEITQAIYVIEQEGGSKEETFLEFSRYKQTSSRRCARLNSPSIFLYVGSSVTKLKNRIKEHDGDGSPSTYALNLKHWFKGNKKITIKVYDQSREVLQLIEDALADDLKPAFGKKGSNTRGQ